MYYMDPFYYEGYYQLPRNYYTPNYIPFIYARQQLRISGQATWTDGGKVTKCGIPWSENQYMTAAVGENSPYKCGQNIKLRHMTHLGPREVIVTVVDQVRGYPPNRINLHRLAFEALGAQPEQGVINIEILPSPQLEEEKWGKYLLEVTQVAYPGYEVTDYNQVNKKQISSDQTRETYEFILQSPNDGEIKIQGNVIYNPNTDKVISFHIEEI